jgi:hypothetical protein
MVRARRGEQVRTGLLVDAVGVRELLRPEVLLVRHRFAADCRPCDSEKRLHELGHVLYGHLLLV